MKILFFGDVVGRVGRLGVRQVIPQIKAEHAPDIIIANAENLAHGTGITPKVLDEMRSGGVDFFTSGNHVWDKPVGEECLQAKEPIVIRPANFGRRRSGQGYRILTVGEAKLLVINLQGQVWMKDEVDNPFLTLDAILAEHAPHNFNAIFIDVHGEATSEKIALAHYADGRVTAVVGTHTHVPTADARILPGGTALLTDVGMTGARDSIIGVQKEPVIQRFLGQKGQRFEYAEEGACDVNAVLIETGEGRRATSIRLLQWTVET
ncbi:MAG: YmdB family metallophosphoesterase [Parcubacteria group bacterium]|nr:YmdB family metallophosphoesterase [Parcubacteria group bacterium]